LRRTLLAITAATALIAAAVAYAATANTYTAKVPVLPTKAGTAKKPMNVAVTQQYHASNSDSTKVAEVLKDIKVTLYGVKANPKPFPKCTDAMIIAAKDDQGCPKKALIATGQVHSFLTGKGSGLSKTGATACDPQLDAWNGGGGKIVYFFRTTPTPGSKYYCASVPTGATPPYDGTVKESGKNMVLDTPLPPYVSTNVTGIFYGSLVDENLVGVKETAKVKGKTVGFFQSFGCKGKKRPFSVTFTATDGAKTVKGTDKCS